VPILILTTPAALALNLKVYPAVPPLGVVPSQIQEPVEPVV